MQHSHKTPNKHQKVLSFCLSMKNFLDCFSISAFLSLSPKLGYHLSLFSEPLLLLLWKPAAPSASPALVPSSDPPAQPSQQASSIFAQLPYARPIPFFLRFGNGVLRVQWSIMLFSPVPCSLNFCSG